MRRRHMFVTEEIKPGMRLAVVAAIAALAVGCGGPTPNTTPPSTTLQIWRDPDLAATAANISSPFTAATPTIPTTFVAAAFTTPLPNQHNVSESEIQGWGCGCCGWHVSNKENHILEYKVEEFYDTETTATRNLMKALVCTHEISHYWWNGHASGTGNVMNPSLSDNLALYRAGTLPAFTISQANKIKKTIL